MQKIKTRSIFTIILALLCSAVVALGVSFALPKTDSLNASAALGAAEVSPTLTRVSFNKHNIYGGDTATMPSSVTYGSFNGGDDGSGRNFPNNLSITTGGPAVGTQFVQIVNTRSTLDGDMGFIEFSMNVTVPAGGKVTVKYEFNATVKKSADTSDGSSHWAAEMLHFGTGNPVTGDGSNPVNVSSLALEPSGSGGTYTQIRLDGTDPTSVHTCTPLPPNPSSLNNANHPGAVYPNMGTATGVTVPTGSYTTSAITYENTTSQNQVFKEYFGFMGSASTAAGSCHILYAYLSIDSEVTFEKVGKPTAANPSQISKEYTGSPQTFVLSNLNVKSELIEVKKTTLDGTETTIYSHNFYTDVTTPDSGTNPLSGNSCSFTDTGKYVLKFRPNGAVWSDTIPGTPNTNAHEITFYILPKKINKPTVAPGDASGKTYDGTSQTFTLSKGTGAGALTPTTWPTYIDIDSAKGGSCPTDVTDNNDGSFSITNAGDYDIYLTLKDEVNTCWSDSNFTTTDWSGPAGTTCLVSLKMKPFELTVDQLDCDKLDTSSNWAWNMGDTATVTLKLSGFKLAAHTTQGDSDSVTLSYYYTLNGGAENAVSAETEIYDPATKTISATIKMPATLAQGTTYKFGVKPDDSTGAGKNYTVKTSLAEKSFTVSAKGFDPSQLVWTYTVDGVSDTTKRIADGDKLTYALKSDGTATVYNPQIMLIFDTSDFTDKVAVDTTYGTSGYNGSIDKSVVSSSYATTVKLKIIDSDTQFIAPNPANPNITIAADGKSAEITLNWEISKAEVDLTNLKLEYGWYDDDKGDVVWNDYDPDNKPEYRSDSPVYIRVKGGTNYPDGITNAEVVNEDTDYLTDRDLPGEVKVKVKFTLDSNFYYDTDNGNTTFTKTVSIELSEKKIPVSWILTTVKDGSGNEVLDENGLPYQIYVLDFSDNPDLEKYVKYEYYYADMSGDDPVADTLVPSTASGTTTHPQLDRLIDVDGAGKKNGGTATKTIDIIIRPVIDTSVPGAENYVLDLPDGSPDGADQYTKLGQKKNAVTVTQVKNEVVYGTKVEDLKDLYTLIKNGTDYSTGSYTAVIYKGNDSSGAVDVSSFDFAAAEVGTYTIKFTLKDSAAKVDALSKTNITLEIVQQEIEVPQIVGDIVFNSETLNLANFLDGKYQEYLDKGIISPVSGRATARDVGTYIAVIEIINPNYKWKLPADDKAESKKLLVRLSVADEQVSSQITLDGAAKQAEYSWKIAPYKLGTDIIDLSGKDGAKINIDKLPEWVRNLINDGGLTAGIAYYADEAGTTPLTDEEIVLKPGRSYYVGAVLGGDESKNFTFASDGTVKNTSPAVTYKVPQSGSAAFIGNVKEAMTKLYFGLPLWAWLLIALAVLILLIIIIAVACKRRKSKEERAEAKARKEEERERREEERRLQREKLEAERELAKAKQEAELEKIRAQAQMAAGAGMASMAMQQAPQQQAMPQQMPQPQIQQVHDDSAVRRLEAEVAEMRAKLANVQQPAPQNAIQPYSQQPAVHGGSELDEIKMQLAIMRAEQQASKELTAMKTELEMARLAAQQHGYYDSRQKPASGNMNAELLGDALISAFSKMMGQRVVSEQPALPGKVEENVSQPVITQYPSDAVITTTTTVDTTKPQPRRGARDGSDDFSDVDGFYDSIDY